MHPVLAAYRDAVVAFVGPQAQSWVNSIDVSGTSRGDAQRLRWLVADRTVRRLLPVALDARGEVELAGRLRALPPLLNEDTDALARPLVAEAVARLESRSLVAHGTTGGTTARATDSQSAPDHGSHEVAAGPTAVEAAEHAQALAEYAEAYARAYRTGPWVAAAVSAAVSDAVDAGAFVARALRWDAPVEAVGAEVTATLLALRDAARRRERLPRADRTAAVDETSASGRRGP
ncbi:MAG: hypothetical protein NZ898_04145 [Myxococcota bacterium]|nr:hypothetical protein [Myxococcota bacterium]MDW8360862.1 hypothetical protein [Myxococcales bacterium]